MSDTKPTVVVPLQLTREQLEQKLYEAEHLLSLVIENNPFGYFWKDLDLRYVGSNQRFAETAGFKSPSELIGKTDYEMPWGIDNEVGANACRSSDFEVITSGREQLHIIEQIKQENGSVLWTEASKVPMRDRAGKVVGVLGVMEDITARKLAEQALEEANRKLEELCRIDGLTQIANRRHFDELIEAEWSRALRNQLNLSVILFDVDHFKKFNDQYGHQVGDQCLVAVAAAAQTVVKRSTDLLARFGGEEFVIVLPNTAVEEARLLAEQVRLAVEEIDIKCADHPIHVTISLGLASCCPKDFLTDSKQLIALADQSLYKAKALGRNCVVVHKVN